MAPIRHEGPLILFLEALGDPSIPYSFLSVTLGCLTNAEGCSWPGRAIHHSPFHPHLCYLCFAQFPSFSAASCQKQLLERNIMGLWLLISVWKEDDGAIYGFP